MKTTIGIIYFTEQKVEPTRRIHTVNNQMLNAWIYFYKKSRTQMKPCLLTDPKTPIPKEWPYEVHRIQESEPPQRLDVLNKVGWLKSQGYKVLGRCVIMDLDCMIMNSIDELDTLDTPIAMPVDPAKRTYDGWPEVGEELNAGTMLFNSNRILLDFRKWWAEKIHYLRITYYDEIIFSAICRSLGGQILDWTYNGSWTIGDDAEMYALARNPALKILHFHGQRKMQLATFLKRAIPCL